MKRSSGSRGRMSGWKVSSSLAAGCIFACLAASSAGSATATTGAGYILLVKGVMTNSSFVLVHKKAPGGGLYVGKNGTTATFVRGTHVIFRVSNNGSKPYLPAIKAIQGPYMPPLLPQDKGEVYTVAAHMVARPGGKVDLSVTFLFRGQYKLLRLFHKKPLGKPVEITVT